MGCDRIRNGAADNDRTADWAALGGWLGSPPSLRGADLEELRDGVRLVGRARASLAALEADLVTEISRRDGDTAAEEILRRDQKRSRSGARKAVKTAAHTTSSTNGSPTPV